MKKYAMAFMISAAVFSLSLQALFAVYLFRTEALSSFIYIRRIIEKNARLSVAAADSYMEFKRGPGTAILAMPSCNTDKTLVPGSFDFFVMHASEGTSVFSLYPSKQSARRHASFYTKNLSRAGYKYAGGLFGFTCEIRGTAFSRNFYMNPAVWLLPSGTEAF